MRQRTDLSRLTMCYPNLDPFSEVSTVPQMEERDWTLFTGPRIRLQLSPRVLVNDLTCQHRLRDLHKVF